MQIHSEESEITAECREPVDTARFVDEPQSGHIAKAVICVQTQTVFN